RPARVFAIVRIRTLLKEHANTGASEFRAFRSIYFVGNRILDVRPPRRERIESHLDRFFDFYTALLETADLSSHSRATLVRYNRTECSRGFSKLASTSVEKCDNLPHRPSKKELSF